MATQVEHLQPQLLATLVDDNATIEQKYAAAEQIALWAERVFDAIRELQEDTGGPGTFVAATDTDTDADATPDVGN